MNMPTEQEPDAWPPAYERSYWVADIDGVTLTYDDGALKVSSAFGARVLFALSYATLATAALILVVISPVLIVIGRHLGSFLHAPLSPWTRSLLLFYGLAVIEVFIAISLAGFCLRVARIRRSTLFRRNAPGFQDGAQRLRGGDGDLSIVMKRRLGQYLVGLGRPNAPQFRQLLMRFTTPTWRFRSEASAHDFANHIAGVTGMPVVDRIKGRRPAST